MKKFTPSVRVGSILGYAKDDKDKNTLNKKLL